MVLERTGETEIEHDRLIDDSGPYFEGLVGNQDVELGYRPRGTAKGLPAQDFAGKNATYVLNHQVEYQTPEQKAGGWRAYVVEMIKMFKCVQGAVDQAEYVAVESLAQPNVPPEGVMQSWFVERSGAQIRASNLVNEKVLMGPF